MFQRFSQFENTLSGDWGDLCDEDKQTNEDALSDGGRIFSAYHLSDGTEIWIISEADRCLRDAIAKHPENVNEQQAYWRQKTGKNRASFYRCLSRYREETGE